MNVCCCVDLWQSQCKEVKSVFDQREEKKKQQPRLKCNSHIRLTYKMPDYGKRAYHRHHHHHHHCQHNVKDIVRFVHSKICVTREKKKSQASTMQNRRRITNLTQSNWLHTYSLTCSHSFTSVFIFCTIVANRIET